MATTYNKVTLDGVTLIDLSQDTVADASHIRQGYIGHLNDGTQVTGTFTGGVTFSALPYPFLLTNERTGTVSVVRVMYDNTTGLAAVNSNITKGSTATYDNMLTDGTHVWFRLSNGTTLKYNGSNADYVRSGSYFKVTLPNNFDGTIPYVFT